MSSIRRSNLFNDTYYVRIPKGRSERCLRELDENGNICNWLRWEILLEIIKKFQNFNQEKFFFLFTRLFHLNIFNIKSSFLEWFAIIIISMISNNKDMGFLHNISDKLYIDQKISSKNIFLKICNINLSSMKSFLKSQSLIK